MTKTVYLSKPLHMAAYIIFTWSSVDSCRKLESLFIGTINDNVHKCGLSTITKIKTGVIYYPESHLRWILSIFDFASQYKWTFNAMVAVFNLIFRNLQR